MKYGYYIQILISYCLYHYTLSNNIAQTTYLLPCTVVHIIAHARKGSQTKYK